MFPYLFVIVLGSIIAYECNKVDMKRTVACALFSATPYALLAALRDVTVGTDTSNYPLSLFNQSQTTPLDALVVNGSASIEPLFIVFVWIITNIFHNFNVLLFFLQLAVCAPVCFALFKITPKYAWAGLGVYGFVFYGFTLNIMRQSMCMAFVVLMLCFLLQHKMLAAFVSVLIATGFHNTGLLGLVIWLAWYLCFMGKDSARQMRYDVILIGGSAALLLLTIVVLLLGERTLGLLTLIKDSYIYQVRHAGEGDFDTTAFIYGSILPVFISAVFARSCKPDDRRIIYFFAGLSFFGGVFSQLAILSPELVRVGTYFTFFSIFFYPLLLNNVQQKDLRKTLVVLTVLVCVAYFLIVYVRGNGGNVYPFVFDKTLFEVFFNV